MTDKHGASSKHDSEDDAYLWDRSGKPDPTVLRLEALLGPLAHDRPMAKAARPRSMKRARIVGFAALALVAVVAWLVAARPWQRNPVATTPPPADSSSCAGQSRGSWAFRTEGGAASCGSEKRVAGWVPVNGTIETPDGAKATLDVAKYGTVTLDPGSKLKILSGASEDQQKLDLVRGTMRAKIAAPPRIFIVKTPTTEAVDLGCEYTLTVDPSGAGILSVSSGSVSLEREDRAPTLVTQGASCKIGPRGPGTPLVNTATAQLRAAADELDGGDGKAFDKVLGAASEKDTLTLWHLMRRKDPEERGRAYDRLASFVAPPEKARRESVVKGEREAIAAYREALVTGWFRTGTW